MANRFSKPFYEAGEKESRFPVIFFNNEGNEKLFLITQNILLELVQAYAPASALYCACRHTINEVALEAEEYNKDRNDTEHRAGDQHVIVIAVRCQ